MADCPIPDPARLVSFLAGHTDRLGLATGVLVLPNFTIRSCWPNERRPLMCCRGAEASAVCGCRLAAGRNRRHAALTSKSRRRRADEQLAVLRALWDDRLQGGSHHGEYFQFENVSLATRNQLLVNTFRYTSPVTGKAKPLDAPGASATASSLWG